MKWSKDERGEGEDDDGDECGWKLIMKMMMTMNE